MSVVANSRTHITCDLIGVLNNMWLAYGSHLSSWSSGWVMGRLEFLCRRAKIHDMVTSATGSIIKWGRGRRYWDGSNYFPSMIVPTMSVKWKMGMKWSIYNLRVIKGGFGYGGRGCPNGEGLSQRCRRSESRKLKWRSKFMTEVLGHLIGGYLEQYMMLWDRLLRKMKGIIWKHGEESFG